MQKRKADVIRKATQVFSLYGPRTANMNQVATKAGVSKRTLYKMFPAKEYLVVAVAEQLIKKNNQFSRVCRSMSPNALIELKNLFVHINNLLLQTPPHFVIEIKKYYQEAYQILEKYSHNMVTDFIRKNMERGMTEGIYRSGIETQATGHLYYWLLRMTTEDMSLGKANIPGVVASIHDFFIHGVINAEGEKLLRIIQTSDRAPGTHTDGRNERFTTPNS
ncbi:MAG: TetR/AcrR family transcriptional regulator [Chitinophagaceae bacterium]|nr:TetR/AcrR family transcriptional regulator [Chitinophagaceae bacterium]